MASVRLNWCGIFPCAPDWMWDTATTPLRDFDLWAVFDGRGQLRTPEGRIDLATGECLVLRPGERYVCRHSPDAPLLVHVIHYDYLDQDGEPVQPDEPPPLRRPLTDVTFFRALTSRVVSSHGAGHDAAAQHWLHACLEELQRQDALHRGDDERTRRIEQLCTRIVEAPAEEWRIEDIATSFHLSPDHFTREFKALKGVPPREYILRARIDSARRLLLSSSHSVTRIAALTGFGDIYHFNRQFKRRTGRSPTRFRKLGPE
jgi:AraC-like DNA-binding protein